MENKDLPGCEEYDTGDPHPLARPLTPQDLDQRSVCATVSVNAGNVGRLTLRLLRESDTRVFGEYLDSLSEGTRALYAPHPLNAEHAGVLCKSIDNHRIVRLVAEKQLGDGAEIVAYFIIFLFVQDSTRDRYTNYQIDLDADKDCEFAPSVADAYQSLGVASALMPPIVELTRRLGRRHMVLAGGTQERNRRAIHFYEKWGFSENGRIQGCSQ